MLTDYPQSRDSIEKAIELTRTILAPMKRRVVNTKDPDLVKLTEKFREASSDAASKVAELAAAVRTDLERARGTA